MRAVLLSEIGGPEVLRIEDLPTPQPSEGQALIRVRAASVHPIDWKYRSGTAAKQLPGVQPRRSRAASRR